MNRDWLKLVGAGALAISMTMAAPVMAQDAFEDWDANDDLGLDDEEFGLGFGENGVFDDWDADDDDLLSEDEFNAGVFRGYDRDDDDIIEEPEFGDYGDDIGDEGFWDV